MNHDRLLDALLATVPDDLDLAVVRDGDRWVLAVAPAESAVASGLDALDRLDGLDRGWWAVALSYDLGRVIERIPTLANSAPALPDLIVARFDARLILSPHAPPHILGEGTGRELLEAILATALGTSADPSPASYLEGWRSSLDREAFEHAVSRIVEHLHAGDCYQVNLTRRLETSATMDPLVLFRALVQGNPAPHAALLRIGDVSIVSASPERFLRRDGDRVETRPIKGTGRDPEALVRSPKDRAENIMIVDLARNDLGRVCSYGTVTVPALCTPEAHPGLYHLVSTVTGHLRPGVGVGELVRATFPPASVTGAPKPRVLEIIETLEPVRRGFYCGAVGFVDADHAVVDLNVAIRTFTIACGRTFFGVGGGIVADSDPGAEWQETELKAARLLEVAAGRGVPVRG